MSWKFLVRSIGSVFKRLRGGLLRAALASLATGMLLACLPAQAEYGDVVMNRQSDRLGVRPVIFSHTFHRMRFRCKVCHGESGFKLRAGANSVSMLDIVDGRYCGSCHNGTVAWGADRCDLCHSGRHGLTSGVIGGHRTGGPGRW